MNKREKKVILKKVENAIDSTDAVYEGSRDKVVSAYEDAKDSVKTKTAEAQEYAKKVRKDTDDYISANPEKSVVGAAAVGMVVGAALAVILCRRK